MPLQPNTGFLIRFAKNVGVNFSIEKNLRKIFNQILKVFIPSASSGFGCWSSDCYPSGCLYSCLQSHQLLGHQLWPEAVEAVEAQCQRKRRYHWGHLWATWNQESLPIYIRKERPSNLYPVPLYKPLVRQKWYKYMVPKGMAVHLDASPFSSRFTILSGSNMNNIHILLPAKPQRNLSLNIFPAQAGNLESDTAERIKENFPVIPIPNTTQMLPVPSRGCLHLRCWCTRVPCVLAY